MKLISKAPRRRYVVLAIVSALGAATAYGLLASTASAAGIVTITPHALQTNTAVTAGKSVTPIVSGGATTVPTDATRVQFSISITRPAASGTLTAFPTGDQIHGVGSVPFSTATTATGTLTELVGVSNKVTFVNNSSGTIVLTVKIIGYSTQVLASDVAGTGGVAGQVLTNTGAGAAWQTPGKAYEQTAGAVVVDLVPSAGWVPVASVTVPPGSYAMSFTGTFASFTSTTDDVLCLLQTPTAEIQEVRAIVNGVLYVASVAAQGLITTTTTETVTMMCIDNGASGNAHMSSPVLIATAMGTVSGHVVH